MFYYVVPSSKYECYNPVNFSEVFMCYLCAFLYQKNCNKYTSRGHNIHLCLSSLADEEQFPGSVYLCTHKHSKLILPQEK